MRIRRTTSVLAVGTLLLSAALTAGATGPAGAAPDGGSGRDCRNPHFRAVATPSDTPAEFAKGLPWMGVLRDLTGTAHAGDDVWFAWNSGLFTRHPYLLRHTDGKVQAAPQIPVLPRRLPMGAGPMSFSSPDDGWMLSPTIGMPTLNRWHDGRWTMVPAALSADPTDTRVGLGGLAAVSDTDAWTVGSYYLAKPGVIGNTVLTGVAIQRWDGTQWRNFANPMSEVPAAVLRAVSARAADDVWAVGAQRDADGILIPIAMHFDGTRWETVPTQRGNLHSSLFAVSAAAPDDVWAVGSQNLPDSDTLAAAMVEHWDGTRWSIVPGLPDFGNARLNRVAALGGGRAMAIAELAGGIFKIAYYDGSAWRALSTPGPRAPGLAYEYDGISAADGEVLVAGIVQHVPSFAVMPQVARLSCERR